MKFAELTQVALLGTGRQVLPAALAGTPLETLQAQLDATQREPSLLAAAGLAAMHQRAGALAARDPTPLAEPCPAEESRRVNAHAGSLLGQLLAGEHPPLLSEWLALATQIRCQAPPELLPALLAKGAGQPDLREAILPVLGRRGRWLAARHPDWTWVADAGADEAGWQTDEPAARRLLLRQIRRAQPARALELLAATWKEESPDDRVAFLHELEPGLSVGDEALLETALDDKRKEVRRAAATLLGRLPESALARRMAARARKLLDFAGPAAGSLLRLKKSKPAVLQITLPAECDQAMQRDGVESKPPAGWGERAWWLAQILEAAPLATWTREWNATPDEILAASFAGEWMKELLEAWSRAAVRQRNAVWAEALFPATAQGKRFDLLAALLAVMPAANREARLGDLLAADDAGTQDGHGALLAQCRHDWSDSFSRRVLDWLRRVTAGPGSDWQLRNQLKDLAPRLAPAVLDEAAAGWRTDSADWSFWSKGVEDFLASAQFRQELRRALPRQDQPD